MNKRSKADQSAEVKKLEEQLVALDPEKDFEQIQKILADLRAIDPLGVDVDAGWEDFKERVTPSDHKEEWTTWEEVQKQLFTPEEIAESDRRVAEIGKQIKAEQEDK